MLLVSVRREVAGTPVYFAPELREQIPSLLAKLQAALELLAGPGVRPRAAVGHYIKRFLIGPLPHIRGEWDDALQLCTLDAGFMGTPATTTAEVASTILHEAQHARLTRLGVRYNATTRLRVERVCIQAQLDFAARLQDTKLAGQLKTNLSSVDEIWDQARIKQLRLNTFEGWLLDLKLPPWAERIARRVIRRAA